MSKPTKTITVTIDDFEELVAAATIVGLMSVLLKDIGHSVKMVDLTPLEKLTNEVNEQLAEIVRNKFD